MNRYALWKYILIVVAILFGVIYTLPNFFGESPAVQISSAKATIKVDNSLTGQVEQILQKNGFTPDAILFDNTGNHATVRARFAAGMEDGMGKLKGNPRRITGFPPQSCSLSGQNPFHVFTVRLRFRTSA